MVINSNESQMRNHALICLKKQETRNKKQSLFAFLQQFDKFRFFTNLSFSYLPIN